MVPPKDRVLSTGEDPAFFAYDSNQARRKRPCLPLRFGDR